MKKQTLLTLTMAAACAAGVPTLASAQYTSPGPGAPPFQANASVFRLEPNDVAEHLCTQGYLTSVRAMAEPDNNNIPIIFVDRSHGTADLGSWLHGVAGFRLARAIPAPVRIEMICSSS